MNTECCVWSCPVSIVPLWCVRTIIPHWERGRYKPLAVSLWAVCVRLCMRSWELKVRERRDKHHHSCQSEHDRGIGLAVCRGRLTDRGDMMDWTLKLRQEGKEFTTQRGKRDRNQWRQCIIEQWTYIAFWKKCFKRNIPADTPKHPAHCNPVSFLWSERLSAHFADFTASLNASSSKTKTLLKAAKSLVSPSKHSAGADKATVSIVSHCALELPNIRHNWGECGQKLSIREFI